MKFDYDAVIIGGGPVGSTIAYYLAQNNFNVAIVEKKTQIGYPLQCAGLLSRHIQGLNELPGNLILNEVKGAFIHSGNNNMLKVQKDYTAAYVIDRIAYDEFLLKRAIDSSVKLINNKALSFDISEGITYLDNDEKITSKVIVGCDGYDSILSKQFNNHQKYFNASQSLVKINNIENYRNSDCNSDDYVDTFICEDILPGFLWIIPIKNNLYRVGMFSEDSHKTQKQYIEDFLDKHFDYEILENYKGFIPIFDSSNRIVKERALLIGDAAAQVKPSTGGGLLLAFDACRIACKHIMLAIDQDDISLLDRYEREFRLNHIKELSYQSKVHRILSFFNDDDFEYIFTKLKENDCEEIISEYGDMDRQSVVVKEFINRRLVFKVVPSVLAKKVFRILIR